MVAGVAAVIGTLQQMLGRVEQAIGFASHVSPCFDSPDGHVYAIGLNSSGAAQANGALGWCLGYLGNAAARAADGNALDNAVLDAHLAYGTMRIYNECIICF